VDASLGIDRVEAGLGINHVEAHLIAVEGWIDVADRITGPVECRWSDILGDGDTLDHLSSFSFTVTVSGSVDKMRRPKPSISSLVSSGAGLIPVLKEQVNL